MGKHVRKTASFWSFGNGKRAKGYVGDEGRFLGCLFFGVVLFVSVVLSFWFLQLRSDEDDFNKALADNVVHRLALARMFRADGIPPATFDGFVIPPEESLDGFEHDFTPSSTKDVFGTPFLLETDGETYSVTSAGRDKAFGTLDDVEVSMPVSELRP